MKKSIILFAFISHCLLNSILLYAQDPAWLWAKSAGGISMDYPQSIAVDASGNIYMAGCFYSPTLILGLDTLRRIGKIDIFLVKYDANGNVLWAKSTGGLEKDCAMSIALDATGNPYVVGFFESSTITFDTIVLTNVGNGDLFVAKYDTSGDVLWAKSAGGLDRDAAYSVAVDVSGNAYVTGEFYSSIMSFGSNSLSNAGECDIFVAKYDSEGTIVWTVRSGETGFDKARSIAVDASANIFLTGFFDSPLLIVGSDTLFNEGMEDVFLAKFNVNGNVLWANRIGDSLNEFDPYLAVEPSGNIYLTGTFNSTTLTFGNTILVNQGAVDIFLTKYDSSGHILWATDAGSWGCEYPKSIAVDADGCAYVWGDFNYISITFGTITLTNNHSPSSDMFLAKFDTSGDVLWAKKSGGTDIDYAMSLAFDLSENFYVAGCYLSPSITFGYTTLTNSDNNFDIFLSKSGSNIGINERMKSSNISVYPNPASSFLTVESDQLGELTVMDIQGNSVMRQAITQPTTTIDVKGMKSGIYIVKIVGEKGVQVGKFIKE